MSVDYAHAELLMQVIKLSAELGPMHANSLAALASAELKNLDNEAKADLQAQAAEIEAKRAEALAAQQAQAEAKAKAAAEAAEADDDEARQSNVRPGVRRPV